VPSLSAYRQRGQPCQRVDDRDPTQSGLGQATSPQPTVRLAPYGGLPVPTIEEITYEAGRSALADQESVVAGIRQRTGTLLAAHALVASFLGATAVHARGLRAFGWVAIGALLAGLVVSAVLLAPWRLKFAVDARELVWPVLRASGCRGGGEHPWLAGVGRLQLPSGARRERPGEPSTLRGPQIAW
jgi:hypothetical protein